VTRARPVPEAGEVLIQVAAAGVNRPDVMQRQGAYPPPPRASDIPGLEVAGTIISVGPEVSGLSEGDRVCALLAGGGYAEYAVADARLCLPIPDQLDVVQAAALPETFFTVWHNVFERAKLQPGEIFLVHGGSSGIGTTAIQLAKAFGATVYTTAGSAEKCAICEKLGATRAINYKEEDFVAILKEEAGGADVILDMVGGDYIQRDIKALKVEGRHVNIAFLKGAQVELNMMPVLLKRLSLLGSVLRSQPTENKARIARALHEQVWPLLADGRIKPVIHATYPLAGVAEAHRVMERSEHIGKLVLVTESTG